MGREKVLIAMSGGVDSSVAAFFIKDGGRRCAGATMRLLPEAACVDEARAAARRLDIPFFVFDMEDEFRSRVMAPFAAAYKAGLTPNPCVECNRFLKFGSFFTKAVDLGAGAIATGHYASVGYDAAARRWTLKKGADEEKDQSYVLYSLTQEELSRTILPLGGLTKREVRAAAAELGLASAAGKESQDICFVPDGDYVSFIERFTGQRAEKGPFVDCEGRVVGEHRGLIRYTIGQRRGLGLSLREPLYVCAKNAGANTVVLGGEASLMSKILYASRINLIACRALNTPIRVKAKVRYRQREQWATVEQVAEDRIRVEFDEPQRAVTPGQSVVLYDGSFVVGGGVIE